MTPEDALGQLEMSCEATRDLYLFMLCIINPLVEEARSRMEASRNKFKATEEEKNPNLKFIQSRIPRILAEDPDFEKIVKKKKLSWSQYDVLLRRLFEDVRERDWYQDYMRSPSSSLQEEAALWVKIFENEFEDNEELAGILEDLSIWWNDDLGYALGRCCQTLRDLGDGKQWNLPPLYMSELDHKAESDSRFIKDVVRTAVCGLEGYCAKVAALTPKWDRSRICSTDLALIATGLAENEACPDIASKITINEYVEISKYYSTPESRSFVNGLLDKLITKR